MKTIIMILMIAISVSSVAFGQTKMSKGATQPVSKQALLCTWHLVRFELVRADGRVQEPFGTDISGMLVYLADGGMSVVNPERPQVVHHVKGAFEPNVVGTDRTRSATLKKDTLTLAVPPSECWRDLANYCAPREKIQARLIWRRQ